MSQHDQLLAILEVAASEPIGIIIQTNDTARARAALYRARMAANNPRYAALQFRIWPHGEGDLAICHSGAAKPPVPNNLGTINLDLDLDTE